MKLYYISFLILFIPLHLKAQITFNKRLHFEYPAAVFNSIAVTDSAYYVNGVFADTVFPYKTSQIFAKFNLNGDVLFHKVLRDTTTTFETFSTPFLIQNDTTLITGGYSVDDSLGARGMVLQFDTAGNLQDSIFYYSPYHPQQPFIVTHDLLLTEDGGFIVLNFVESWDGVSNGAIAIAKFSSDGVVEWRRAYDTSYEDRPESIIKDGSGYIIGAWRSNLNTHSNNFWSATDIFKIDSIGETQWSYLSPFQQLQDAAYGIAKTEDGGLVVASGWGTEDDVNGSFSLLLWDGYIFKLDENKKIEWDLILRGGPWPAYNYFNKLIAVSDGSGYLAAGNVENPNYDEIGYDISGWLVKVSPEGDSLWSRLLHHVVSRADFHTFYDLQETADGGFIMVGEARDDGPGFEFPRQRAWLIKVDEHGCLVPGCHIETSTSDPDHQLIVKTYPNPATDYLNIYFRSPTSGGTFQVVDLWGRVVKRFENTFTEVTHLLPVSDLAIGMYYLQYQQQGKLLHTSAFVIQR